MNSSDTNNKDEDRPRHWRRLKRLFDSTPQTTEDVVAIVDAASENEVIDKDAQRIIAGALEVSEMQARDIMIPRTQMTVLKAADSLQENLDRIIESGHSRYPVIGENIDDVLGILLSKDLLAAIVQANREDFLRSESAEKAQGEAERESSTAQINLLTLLRPPVFVPESKRLNVLLRQFRENRNHMALVIDEYGSLAGLITIEDVLEEIVGDIEDEHDDVGETQIRKLSDNHYVINALLPIEDFNEQFGTELEDDEFDTMGGFITNRFGRLPARNDKIELDQFTFHVMQADSRRVRMLRMTIEKPAEEESEDG